MKKILAVVATSAIILFFGYGVTVMSNKQEAIDQSKETFEQLQREDLESIKMIYLSIYEYSFSEAEMDQFVELSKEVLLGASISEDAVSGDGCGSYGEIVIQNKDGVSLHMETSSVYGAGGATINGNLYVAEDNSMDQLAEFLSGIENREFLSVNQKMGAKAEFPLKDLKEAEIESIALKKNEEEYHLSEDEIDDFCEQFWDLAFYEEIKTYKAVQDIYDVFETDVLIQKSDNEIIKLRLNYKVININDKSHIIRIVAQGELYDFIQRRMGMLS